MHTNHPDTESSRPATRRGPFRSRVIEERRRGFTLRQQLGLVTPLIVAWSIASIGLAAAGIQNSVPLEQLFLDPSYLANAPWYAGLLSNLGILSWTVAAVTAAGGSWVAFHTQRASAGRFLGVASFVATVFLADDLLLLHSGLLRQTTGMPKTAAMALVCIPALIWVVLFHDEIRRTRWIVLAAAGAGLATSVGVDIVFSPAGASGLMLEDGAKFMGVVAFAVYNSLTAVDIARSTIRVAMSQAAMSQAPGQSGASDPAISTRSGAGASAAAPTA
jgi:hypothetical protein